VQLVEVDPVEPQAREASRERAAERIRSAGAANPLSGGRSGDRSGIPLHDADFGGERRARRAEPTG
jgi:hypothetical protein